MSGVRPNGNPVSEPIHAVEGELLQGTSLFSRSEAKRSRVACGRFLEVIQSHEKRTAWYRAARCPQHDQT